MQTVTAYDYDAQRWVTGASAATLRRRQLRETLELVEGPRGAEYLRFTGSDATPEQVAAEIRASLGAGR